MVTSIGTSYLAIRLATGGSNPPTYCAERLHAEVMTTTHTTTSSRQLGCRAAILGAGLNITRVAECIWTGGDLPADREAANDSLHVWHRLGIRQIIDNRIEWSDAALVAAAVPDIQYCHNGVDDAGQHMPDEWFDTIAETGQAALDRRDAVLLHCHMGINRGPSAAFALLLTQGWDAVDAISAIRTARPIAAVSYAEDALDWWHRRVGVSRGQRRIEAFRLAAWRAEQPHDTVRIIRQIRAGEASL